MALVPHSPGSKQHEKDYLKRTGVADWDRLKPFAPPGRDTVEESVALIHDFAVALRFLAPTPADRLLDLGAGACWCSDWLERLNLRAVSVDIAHDMLALGRTRLRDPRRLVAGDMERLPFASGSFDKAICLNALHHVPDIPAALAEIARVLDADGVAVFSEPGKGHDEKPGSVAAVRDFGVLEQEILVTDFLDACARAGFEDARIVPLAYALPGVALGPADWAAWDRQARRRRPLRAAAKIGRGLMEFLGLGKQGPLFEEAFAATLVRTLKGAMDDHPIVVARKRPAAAADARRFSAAITLLDAPGAMRPGAALRLRVRVRNTSQQTWRAAAGTEAGQVRLGVQLLDDGGRLLNRDFRRADLPSALGPGAEAVLDVTCDAPAEPGNYALKLDLVAEGVTWFEPHGSDTATTRIRVGG
jgi:SAM-dependent methyltransferase